MVLWFDMAMCLIDNVPMGKVHEFEGFGSKCIVINGIHEIDLGLKRIDIAWAADKKTGHDVDIMQFSYMTDDETDVTVIEFENQYEA